MYTLMAEKNPNLKVGETWNSDFTIIVKTDGMSEKDIEELLKPLKSPYPTICGRVILKALHLILTLGFNADDSLHGIQ